MPENSILPTAPSPDGRQVNRVLAALALLATGWTIYGTYSNLSRFVVVFDVCKQIKVQLPGIAILAVEHQAAVVIILLVAAATGAFATFRKPYRKNTAYLNVIGIVLPLLWWVLQTTALYITSSTILEFSYRGGHQIGR